MLSIIPLSPYPMPRKPDDRDSSHHPYLGRDALSPTSTGLILRIKDGESAAWERFVALYLPLIRHWCRKPDGVLTRMDRQEIAQEVLLNVSKFIGDFDEQREGRSLRAWLRKITENAIVDKLEYIKKRLPVSRLASGTGYFKHEKPFELPEEPEKEKSIVLRQVLKIVGPEFSQRDWQIVDLFVNGRKTSSEVAEAMDMKPDTVRRLKNRILSRFSALALELDNRTALDRAIDVILERFATTGQTFNAELRRISHRPESR